MKGTAAMFPKRPRMCEGMTLGDTMRPAKVRRWREKGNIRIRATEGRMMACWLGLLSVCRSVGRESKKHTDEDRKGDDGKGCDAGNKEKFTKS